MENVTEHNSMDTSCEPALLAGVELTVNTPKGPKLIKGDNIIMEEILDPNHVRWGKFVNEMFITYDEMVAGFRKCDHGHKTIRAILRKMGNIDVNKTLEGFKKLGGNCYWSVLKCVVGRYIPFPQIMSPNHESWEEFTDELLRRFKNCDRTNKTTRAVLEKMHGIDVNETLAVFERLGGYCDCEVLLNVVARWLPSRRIMSPNHERWEEFVDVMMGSTNFAKCKHTHKTTRAVLRNMAGIDVKETLDFFKKVGGSCDCGVFFNVVALYLPAKLRAEIYASRKRKEIKEVSA